MRFWDTSAIVPLCLAEPASVRMRRLATEDPALVVWWASRTECASAIVRRRRDRTLNAGTVARARAVLATLSSSWAEVLPSEAVRARAERLLTVHDLRAPDAFQLAAALVWSRGATGRHAVVCLDRRLRDAAAGEGFAVLP